MPADRDPALIGGERATAHRVRRQFVHSEADGERILRHDFDAWPVQRDPIADLVVRQKLRAENGSQVRRTPHWPLSQKRMSWAARASTRCRSMSCKILHVVGAVARQRNDRRNIGQCVLFTR